MISFKSIQYYIKNPKARKMRLLHAFGRPLPDKTFTKIQYHISTGKWLNLNNPQTYTEKLQWLKLNDRRPEYTVMQDKYLVRNTVSKVIGEEYLIPLLGVWDRVEDIDFDKLPNQFVLKCNHDCASVIICRDKSNFDFEKAKKKLRNCMKRNYFDTAREWAYKHINRKIIAEKYMFNEGEKTLIDYKFFCCSGKAKMVLLASGEAHTSERNTTYFDLNLNPLPIQRGTLLPSAKQITKPVGFNKLIPLAEKVAGDFPFIRVDFYLVNGHPYFGEIAFYPSAGLAEFSPHVWEEKIGSWINLPVVNHV